MSCCECRASEDTARGSILYSILNRGTEETPAAHQLCSCASKRKLVATRAPHLVFKAASEVLVKTFKFVKNVPCFRGLPAEDQLRLVRNSWAPLLILGMVQDSVDFDTVETQQPSLLHRILTHSKERQQRAPAEIQHPGVPVSDAEGIKMFLVRCRGLRISVKEYAFLKGAILFTPGYQTSLHHPVRNPWLHVSPCVSPSCRGDGVGVSGLHPGAPHGGRARALRAREDGVPRQRGPVRQAARGPEHAAVHGPGGGGGTLLQTRGREEQHR
ncbi:nuclear receptor subfamily 0 group B member 1-like isoform X1 [Epinephelus moara]|uniref:nuclear receptor subfamily 0 group B member 1-like isoform X1 n=1 Tax=Epinephelus moara TaxID=300413 RepID=UPI00214E5C11|nr:nuclear receptor subfamily 0 group B member 1-like isoform X1 [Epinephelus moara]